MTDTETPTDSIVFTGHVHESEDVSAIAVIDDRHLVIGADEGTAIQLLIRQPAGPAYEAQEPVLCLGSGEDEIDVEGIARNETALFVVGSHSAKRKRIREDKGYEKNRKRLATVRPELNRNRLLKIPLSSLRNGSTDDIERIDSLKALMEQDPYLGPFTRIPSKENGVDIEGIAVKDETVFLGFRGPVLRDNYVPVMRFPFASPEDYALHFVELGGLGIRDMVEVSDGFLLLAGPVGDGPGSRLLSFWNGEDTIPGEDRRVKGAVELARIEAPMEAKAEGLALLSEDDSSYTVLIVFDGLQRGAPRSFRVEKRSTTPEG